MAEGYASDINGDDTVMDTPEATISIDLSQLQPAAALSLAQAAGLDQQRDETVGCLVKGNEPEHIEDARFHIPIEAAITALDELDVMTAPPVEVEQNS